MDYTLVLLVKHGFLLIHKALSRRVILKRGQGIVHCNVFQDVLELFASEYEQERTIYRERRQTLRTFYKRSGACGDSGISPKTNVF